jgi:hypothetical protein
MINKKKEWNDDEKLNLKIFLINNGSPELNNKNLIDCILNNFISLYDFNTFNEISNEISEYQKKSDDPNISLSEKGTTFMSNLISIQEKCSK